MKKFNSFTVCVLVTLFIIPCSTISYSQVPPTPTITSSKGPAICEGDTTILTATSAGATNYLWSTGATTQSINVSIAGSYTVIAGNAFGNSAPAQIFINAGTVTPVAIVVQATLGSSFDEDIRSIQQTAGGGYIAAGVTYTNFPKAAGQHGKFDCCIIKIDSSLHVQWKKYFGGSKNDILYEIRNTSDGGYIIAGSTNSNDGDISGFHGGIADYMIIKIDSTGIIQWQKCLGGTGDDYATSTKQTPDGGYIVAGTSGSKNGDVTINYGNDDFWIAKLDNAGIIQWQKSLGGGDFEYSPCSVILTSGGYIVSGSTGSNNGDVSGNHGNWDYWICKIDLAGTVIWQKCLGGTDQEHNATILQTSDGGYITSGFASSNDGDVSGQHGLKDFWTVKLDNAGTIEWQKCNGGSGDENAESIGQASDGGYILTGVSSLNSGDVAGVHGDYDAWIVKLDTDGVFQWQKCIGGTGNDYGESIEQIPDGGFIFAGSTGSNDEDVSGNHGGHDFWMVKLGPAGSCPAPTADLNATDITSTSVKLNWYAITCAEGYNIQYRQAGATTWKGKTVWSNIGHKSLTSLIPSTEYEWKIKTKCSVSANTTSKFSPIQHFKTVALKEGESIAQNTIAACNIFPNPSPGNFSLSFNSNIDSKGDIEIYNTIGELVYNKRIEINEDENTIEINLKDAPAGVFFLNLKSGNSIYRHKLIKE